MNTPDEGTLPGSGSFDPAADDQQRRPSSGGRGHHTHLAAPADGAGAAWAVRRVFVITLVLNFAVAAAKGGYGYLSGSLALGTDAIHAALDGSSNVLALLSLYWSHAPADERHPYGRRKLEILAALGIGVLIVIGLFEMTAAAIRSLTGHRAPPEIGWWGFGIVAATMVTNFFVTRYEERRGHALGSSLLCADAQHTRSDLYASGAVMLSFIGVRWGMPWADPVGALIVMVMVGRAAWMVFRDNVPTLIDAAVLDPERVAVVASQVSQNCNISRVRSRGLRNAVHLDLHVAVNPSMSVLDAHQLAQQIEKTLRRAYPELSDVVIHTGPTPQASAPQIGSIASHSQDTMKQPTPRSARQNDVRSSAPSDTAEAAEQNGSTKKHLTKQGAKPRDP